MPSSSSQAGFVQEPVAIVGLSCRLPGDNNSPHKLWEFLQRGATADTKPPTSRFNLNGHYDSSHKPGTMRPPGGMFLEKIDPRLFDAPFFNIGKSEAISMDPQQRQLLEVVYEGMENAGLTLENLDGASWGCFVGSFAVDMQSRDPEDRPASISVGAGRAILANRISHFLNIHGPSMTLDTACSGSLIGVDVACRYLGSGEIDGAIVTGCNIYMSPEHVMDTGPMKVAHTLTGKCHTFDATADGYIKAEAINTVLLKRLSDAIRDGDPIRGVIRGTATNSDGRTPGIASPSADAQAAAIRSAYRNAGITNLNDTGYLECHGTGTQAGDPMEVKGASSVFGSCRDPSKPLIIGSIKSNIGHSEPAAGLSGLIKAVLALEHGTIPGTPSFITPNPNIDFAALRVKASRTSVAWPHSPIRRASVNSFGYGGSNCHVIVDHFENSRGDNATDFLRSYVSQEHLFAEEQADSTRPHLLVFSANDEASLRGSLSKLVAHLSQLDVSVKLQDLAYTLNERRSRLFHRGYIVTKGTQLEVSALQMAKPASQAPTIGFVFTGQGAQWPEMGKSLIENFPAAKTLLRELDETLQSLPTPPKWSLIDELSQPRTAEHLRDPEFSQPLVTALQLVLTDILASWGITPKTVVGHSSGEIAAAASAGYISNEDAITLAYYRGLAAKQCPQSADGAVGMLAVGIGADQVSKYLPLTGEAVEIACVNSPNSVTLSGPIKELEVLRSALVEDKHFARMLQVNLAYHSKYMGAIGQRYAELLQDFAPHVPDAPVAAEWFSSVVAGKFGNVAATQYWVQNMVSRVRFSEAFAEMMASQTPPTVVVELGPSGALAGPISQIRSSIQNADFEYTSVMARGADADRAIFNAAGKLYLLNAEVNLAKVNLSDPSSNTKSEGRLLIDLPNYAWNHGSEYWHESEASKDWRFRKFPVHDLLGSKILGTSWEAPSWKRNLSLEDVTWIKDHKMGTDTLFPAAGYISMAVEAINQKMESANEIPRPVSEFAFTVRDIKFEKALVLEADKPSKIMLSLTDLPGSDTDWHEFVISSLRTDDNVWMKHCHGLVRRGAPRVQATSAEERQPLLHPSKGDQWYKTWSDIGYGFGQSFRRQLAVEALPGTRYSRSLVSLEQPSTAYSKQSVYAMHPACIDGCFHSLLPSVWNGQRSSANAVLVPASIDELYIGPSVVGNDQALSLARSEYKGRGRPDQAKNYTSSCAVYDNAGENLLMDVKRLFYHELDTGIDLQAPHTYMRSEWQPDIAFATEHQLQSIETDAEKRLSHVLDLLAYRSPAMRVLELNFNSEQSGSVWFDGNTASSRTYGGYCFGAVDPKAVVEVQTMAGSSAEASFMLLESSDATWPAGDQPLDLVIVHHSGKDHATSYLSKAKASLSKNGSLILVKDRALTKSNGSQDDVHQQGFLNESYIQHSNGLSNGHSTQPGNGHSNGTSNGHLDGDSNDPFDQVLTSVPNGSWAKEGSKPGKNGHDSPKSFSPDFESILDLSSRSHCVTWYRGSRAPAAREIGTSKAVQVVSLRQHNFSFETIKSSLKSTGWDVTEHSQSLPPPSENQQAVVLVIDELFKPLLTSITEDEWNLLKLLLAQKRRIVWLTQGSQMQVSEPSKSLIHGLLRSVRAEDASVWIKTLDVEQIEGPTTAAAIDTILEHAVLEDVSPDDHEFVERKGLIHVSRIVADELVNKSKAVAVSGAPLEPQNIQELSSIAMLRAERLGTLDGLQYSAMSISEAPVAEDCIEVDIHSAALNFKDVAVTMGIVPENEHLLGLEGAGVVRRIAPGVTKFKVGDRIALLRNGTFANRIQVPVKRACRIPDNMSFEDAATIPLVYLTSIYSLFNIGNLKKGQTVLIHSATGGVGLSCIQLAKYAGADIYATAGSDSKRDYLQNTCGIPRNKIFSSRTTDFAANVMRETNGRGIDVIINSLTGELLEETWRICADGGTMVEIGKRDILNRNRLSMEPFDRNCSFRAVDFSYTKNITDDLIERLLNDIFSMVERDCIGPVHPITTFPFDDVPSAFAMMRAGKHMGKIVITRQDGASVTVPVRAAQKTPTLDPRSSYLIVGGLKGLCGSLAILLAQQGARHLLAMSRSGIDDAKSQAVVAACVSLGCEIQGVSADISSYEQVEKAISACDQPIGGVIQGAMMLRDKPFETMTAADFHATIASKVDGTLNVHKALQKLGNPVAFFTMLSSVSGIIGQKGQANYSAGNVFMDAYAAHVNSTGLKASSVALGVIEDVGYVAEQGQGLQKRFDTSVWTPIQEAVLHNIVTQSILQQHPEPIHAASAAQLITGIEGKQPQGSPLTADARFAHLFTGGPLADATKDSQESFKELHAFLLAHRGGADAATMQKLTVQLICAQLKQSLRLDSDVEAARPLSTYGLDSLSAVELRNWIRSELSSEVTSLEITNAPSITSLCAKIVARLTAA